MRDKRGNGRFLVTGLVVGAAAGAGVSLLLAPQAGKETRMFIGRKGGELFSKLRIRARNINADQATHLSRTASE